MVEYKMVFHILPMPRYYPTQSYDINQDEEKGERKVVLVSIKKNNKCKLGCQGGKKNHWNATFKKHKSEDLFYHNTVLI